MPAPASPPDDHVYRGQPSREEPEPGTAEALQMVEARTGTVRDLLGYEPFGLTAPDALRAIVELNDGVDHLLRETVHQARRHGTTWQDIGAVLGISRQAAFQRFGQPVGRVPAAEKTQRRSMAALIGVAERIFAQCADEDWAAVRDHFAPVMLEAVTVEGLSSVWSSLVEAVGRYELPGKVTTRKNGALQIVDLELIFEAGEMAGRIAFDGDGRVAGMLILDPSMLPG
ncbi:MULTISPECIES: DUF3887 domain-containing protein [unclassified Arthrobacter]|uniref:DUF3887 domain-containing protein n=1 Tax=unclassified Arthrobacter TaxID=235627 RepID=UPI001490FD89|nr:DUF3887 domain-containing protein [Arthrobacter sp. AET 35A]NOJ62663.1 DUF3887 domain-containing protein [Arthrobacter sp. 147(2020)]